MRTITLKPTRRAVGIYLLLGLLIACIGLLILAAIAEDVFTGAAIVAFDAEFAAALHANATPSATNLYLAISWMGGTGIVVTGVAVGLLLLINRLWSTLFIWCIGLIGGGLLNMLMKELFQRPRPYFAEPFAIEQSYSFPSAHAMTSLIAYGLLAYFICHWLHSLRARIAVIFVAVNLILWIGISRMTLGVHYFSDVISGFAAGILWMGVCIAAHGILERSRQAVKDAAAHTASD